MQTSFNNKITQNRIRIGLGAILMACLSLNCGVSNVSNLQAEWLFLFELEQATSTHEIANAVNGSVLQSGVIVGTATGDVAAVEVQLDGGAYETAEGTDSWKFSFPTGSDIWRNGSEHTIAVRVRDSLGRYTSQSSLKVSKGENKDINGDGYVDMVVSALTENSYTGSVYIYQGSIDGVNDFTAPASLSGRYEFELFGMSMALGDINADGYADLVVGAAGIDPDTGSVYIYSGSPNGINASTTFASISGKESGDKFGSALALEDINADGYADLVVGAVYANSRTGSVYIYPGNAKGVDSIPSVTLNGEDRSDLYGFRLGLGDINGDGYVDLVVSTKYGNSSSGSVYIYSGSAFGVISSASFVTLTGDIDSRGYGSALALGDINGDGYADLAVGQAGTNSYTGSTYIYSGSVNGIDTSSEAVTLQGQNESDRFGSALSLGDLNGDGYADLAVGATGTNSGKGSVFIYSGALDGVNSSTSSITLNSDTASTNYGSTLTMGDLNSDGYPELLVGNVGEEGRYGTIWIYEGLIGGLDSSTTPLVTIDKDTDTGFGYSIVP